jgi:2-polyprenyl-3-methyl-5-hydroxy-6-metoxy-1,4-benzoquinol methylase
MQEQREMWDKAAVTFDDEPDHGLREPATREAWTTLLMKWLPAQADVLDAGCGTGSLSIVLAMLGHTVTGIDFSSSMIERARAKAEAAGLAITFRVMDASNPQIDQRFDVIVCRHVLWALPSPPLVLQHWMKMLKPNGCLVLIEGFWHTGAGLHADEVLKMLPSQCTNVRTERLSDQPALWGKPVVDERYAIIADIF